jgi:SAM-dependent methyltransferase
MKTYEILKNCSCCNEKLNLRCLNSHEIGLFCEKCKRFCIISSGVLKKIWLSPSKEDENDLEIAQNSISHQYSPSPLHYPDYVGVMQSYEREYLLPIIPFLRENVFGIVDVCCGPGTILEIAHNYGIYPFGVDIEPWSQYSKGIPTLQYECNILDLSQLEVVFRLIDREMGCDLLSCLEGMEHFKHDLRPSFRIMTDILSPKWIYISTTTKGFGDSCGVLGEDHFRSLSLWKGEKLDADHHKAWSLNELCDFLRELGYRTIGWSLQSRWYSSPGVLADKFSRVLALGERI